MTDQVETRIRKQVCEPGGAGPDATRVRYTIDHDGEPLGVIDHDGEHWWSVPADPSRHRRAHCSLAHAIVRLIRPLF